MKDARKEAADCLSMARLYLERGKPGKKSYHYWMRARRRALKRIANEGKMS